MNSPARLLTVLAAAALILPACGEDEGTPDPTGSPAATPTDAAGTPTQPAGTATQPGEGTPTQPGAGTPTQASGTPTAPPAATFDDGYRTSSWVMAAESGLDLNSDGSVDNQMVAVYELSVSVISDALYDATVETLVAGGASQEDAEATAATVQESFDGFMTVESFNTLLANAIEDNRLNFAETVTGEPEAVSLTWYGARARPSGSYELGGLLGSQSGAVAGSSTSMRLGPGTLVYDFSSIYDGPLISQVLMLDGEAKLIVSESYSGFSYSEAELTDGQIGGLVSQENMVSFMRGLVPAGFCNPSTEECTPFEGVNEIIGALQTAYTDPANAAMWSFDLNGEKAAPVGFGWTATSATLVEPSDGSGPGGGGGNP